MDKKECDKGKKYCLNLFSIRSRTEKEIRDKLESKGYSEEVICEIVDRFKQDGLIDDIKFCGEWIETRLRLNPRSVNMLKDELYKKGALKETIDKVIEESNIPEEKEIASGIAEAKIRTFKDLPRDKIKGRLYRLLLSRGFDPEYAEDAVNQAMEG